MRAIVANGDDGRQEVEFLELGHGGLGETKSYKFRESRDVLREERETLIK